MDIFKLFFDHDLRLDKLAKRNVNKTPAEKEAALADFMKPTPTYSKFYLTGTLLDQERFGLNVLDRCDQLLERLDNLFEDKSIYTQAQQFDSLTQAAKDASIGHAILITASDAVRISLSRLEVDNESNVGHFKEELANILQQGHLVVYKEQAHDGYDLHLFSSENIYTSLFESLKPLVGEDFRFFSINSKRMRSERHFYFETWTLGNPPHGAEEVLPGTTL